MNMKTDLFRKVLVSGTAFACLLSNAVEVGDVLRFAADGGLREVSVVARTSRNMFIGALEGYGDSLNATVTETHDGWILDIDDWKECRMLRVENSAGGTEVEVRQKPSGSIRTCQTMKACIPDKGTSGQRRMFAKNSIADIIADWEVDPVTNEIDVLVVFDKTAMTWLAKKRHSSAKDFAKAQIAKMNLALANSGLAGDFKMALSGTFAADFDVTKDCGASRYERLYVALLQLIVNDSDKWAAIRNERERLGADLVMVLANSQPSVVSVDQVGGTVGISYGLEYDSLNGKYGLVKGEVDAYRDSAYAACDVRVVEIDNTFGHELGHLMGAGHSDLIDPRYSSPGPQLFEYSAAWMYRDAVNRKYYYTIMGYNSVDSSFSSPTYSEIPYYSSPLLRHPVTGSVLGDVNHDNVRTLRETYAIVSQYKVRSAASSAAEDPGAESGTDPQPIADDTDSWKVARVLRGVAYRALPSPYDVQGIFELKCGKVSKKGAAKVSAVLTALDGSKKRYASKTVQISGVAGGIRVNWGEGADALAVTISGNQFTGGQNLAGGISVRTASVGGSLASGSPRAYVEETATATAGEVLVRYLPLDGEPITVNGQKWTFGKAVSVKYVKDRGTGAYAIVDNMDASVGRTNKSGMKLSYSAKTGVFRGSFKAYVISDGGSGRAGRLRKYTVKVSGVVVDGAGYGTASNKFLSTMTVIVK